MKSINYDYYKVYDQEGDFVKKFKNEYRAIAFADEYGYEVVYSSCDPDSNWFNTTATINRKSDKPDIKMSNHLNLYDNEYSNSLSYDEKQKLNRYIEKKLGIIL